MRIEWIFLLAAALVVTPKVAADELSFSWLDASVSSLHRHQGGDGHGGRLALSYALSDQAFMYVDGSQQDFDMDRNRRYDFGVGINTDPAAAYVLFAQVGWNNVGVHYPAAPGQQDHGFDAGAGIRVPFASGWEVYASEHYAHNDVLAGHASSRAGVRYALSPQLSLGAGIDVDPGQTAYLFSLRFNY
ncbi:MAG TPA: hypothetical protein VFX47_07085 [Gammaproteobacteria bacterium]|nr:hypothetical protein [Gammaproteobacteria bacterium]